MLIAALSQLVAHGTSVPKRTHRTICPLIAACGVLLFARAASAEEPFTIAVIGDMQRTTDLVVSPTADHYPIFTNITDWIAANAQAQNIRFVSQVGDSIQHGGDTAEYDLAAAAMATFDSATNADGGIGIPWVVSYGNHEAPNSSNGADPQSASSSLNYRNYFGTHSATGVHRNAGDIGFGAASPNGLNTWHTVRSSAGPGAREYLLLNLEFDVPGGPGPTWSSDNGMPGAPMFDAVGWAQSIIDANPGMPTIIQTHIFEGNRSGPPMEPYNDDGLGRNSQTYLFDKLVKENSQVFMVLNGHARNDTHQYRLNAQTQPVLQLLTDYTAEIDAGIDSNTPLAGGYFRQVEFDEEAGQIRVSTFSPSTGETRTDGNSQFTWNVDWATRLEGAALPLPTTPLVAHFTLDDGQTNPTSSAAVDSATAPQNGILTGAIVYNPATNEYRGDTRFEDDRWANGVAGGSASFGDEFTNTSTLGPKSDDVIEVANSGVGSKYDLSGELTIAAWVNLHDEFEEGINSTRHIAGKDLGGGAVGDSFGLNHNMAGDADQLRFMISEGEVNTTLVAPSTLSAYQGASSNNGWVHVVGVFSPDNFMRLYVDGQLQGEFTEGVQGVPSAIDSTTTPFTIGRLGDSYRHSFYGLIDDVQLYSEALDASQLAQLFSTPGVSLYPTLVGDYNDDGVVNAADYVVWRNSLGSEVALPNRGSGITGQVGIADYNAWKSNYGAISAWSPAAASAPTTAVPEPASLYWLGAAASCLWFGLRRRQSWRLLGINPHTLRARMPKLGIEWGR
jgi:hypothetical protein